MVHPYMLKKIRKLKKTVGERVCVYLRIVTEHLEKLLGIITQGSNPIVIE